MPPLTEGRQKSLTKPAATSPRPSSPPPAMPPIGPDNRHAETSEAMSGSEVLSVKISSRGNIRLPQKALEALGSKEGETVELIIKNGTLFVIPAANRPRAYKRIFTLAAKVLNSEENAVLWLHKSQYGLGGRCPIDHMRSVKGTYVNWVHEGFKIGWFSVHKPSA